MEQASEQDVHCAKMMQVENNNKEVANTLGNMHQSTHVVPRFETRLIKNMGSSIASN